MDYQKVVRIRSSRHKSGGMWINRSDYDPARHELFEDGPDPAAKPAAANPKADEFAELCRYAQETFGVDLSRRRSIESVRKAIAELEARIAEPGTDDGQEPGEGAK